MKRKYKRTWVWCTVLISTVILHMYIKYVMALHYSLSSSLSFLLHTFSQLHHGYFCHTYMKMPKEERKLTMWYLRKLKVKKWLLGKFIHKKIGHYYFFCADLIIYLLIIKSYLSFWDKFQLSKINLSQHDTWHSDPLKEHSNEWSLASVNEHNTQLSKRITNHTILRIDSW